MLILSQVFEWILYGQYIMYMSSVKVSQLGFKQAQYNKREKWLLLPYFLINCLCGYQQFVINKYEGIDKDDQDQKKDKIKEFWTLIYIKHFSLMTILMLVGLVYIYIIYSRQRDDFVSHCK